MQILAFDPFMTYNVTDPTQTLGVGIGRVAAAFLVGGLFTLSAFCLQPVAVLIVSYFASDRPEQVNYTQGYVQLCVVTPLMITALLVTSVLWAQATGQASVTSFKEFSSYSQVVKEGWRFWPFHLSIVFVSFWLLSFFAIANRREPRRVLIALTAPVAAVPVLHALFAAIVLVFQRIQPLEGSKWIAFVWGPPLVALSFVLAIVVLIGMMGRDSTDGVREWWSRLGAWLGDLRHGMDGPGGERRLWTAVGGVGHHERDWNAMTGAGRLDRDGRRWPVRRQFAVDWWRRREGIGAKAKELLARGRAIRLHRRRPAGRCAYVLHLVVRFNDGGDWWVTRQPAEPLADSVRCRCWRRCRGGDCCCSPGASTSTSSA